MKKNYDDEISLSTIVHNTRNPIMILGGFARSLRKQLSNQIKVDAVAKDYFDSLCSETSQLEGILGELITQSQKIESSRIVRSIEFEPQYYQAGLSILTYFNTIVSQKYPDSDIKVKIEQVGNLVKLIIETPDGEKEEITKTLDQYGLVIKGEIPPEALCLNPFEVMSLKNKLELAALELRQAEQLHRICEQKNTERISSLEYNVKQLQNMVADGIKNSVTSVSALREIFLKYNYDTNLKYDLQILLDKINGGISASDEQEVKQILTNINSSEPNLLSELKHFAMGTLTGVSGNYLYTWIVATLAKY